MPDANVSSLEQRLEALERQVRDLKNRLAALEAGAKPGSEHPSDRAVVREKATYDWQGTR